MVVATVPLDATVLLFTGGVAVLVATLCGLAPALKSSRPDISRVLQAGFRRASGAGGRTRDILVVVEMALSLAKRCMEKDCGDWSLEDWMYERYANDWIEGVQYKMMSMIAKPWSNPAAASFHGKMFALAMSRAKVEGEKGLVFNTQNWRFPRGGFIR